MKKPSNKLLVTLIILDLISTFTVNAIPFLAMSYIFNTVSTIMNLVNVINPPQKEVLKKMEVLHDKMRELNKSIIIPRDFVRDLPDILLQSLRLQDLQRYAARLDTLYKDYEEFSKNPSQFESSTIENFAKIVTSHGSMSGNDLLDQLNSLIFPPTSGLGDKGIIRSFIDSLEGLDNEKKCKIRPSPHAKVYTIYKSIEFQELKTYVMTHFGYAYLTMNRKGNYTSNMERLTDKYKNIYSNNLEFVADVIHALPREPEPCP